jgi:hypothetical protein
MVDVPVALGLLFMSGAGGLGGVGVFGDCASAPAEASAAAAMTAIRFDLRFISGLLSFVGRAKTLRAPSHCPDDAPKRASGKR